MVVDSSAHPYVPSESAQPLTAESCNNVASQPAVHVKQNASPRPSILRKRDTEGTPGKAAKNLNPLFGSLTVSTPSSPPSPPRGNGGAQSSGGSTTISATSSPGLGTDSPPLKPDIVEDDRPLEMSPRKKPRKQQLELVRDADFNHDLGYLDEPVPGPSGDTVYSNSRPNKPTLDSVDLVINEVVQNYNPRNDFTGNEGTECRPNPKRRKLPPITYPWVNDTNFIPHIFPFDSSKSGINADSGISKESTNLDFFSCRCFQWN
ncbi:hypothetical protein J6590_028090 [Homalodisca vitripennis]|nr:hypothetical protein J6590_028090 [Homalodisca vitripennis]